MIYSSLYKTVENNGLLAHIYDHLLAQYVVKTLQGRGLFTAAVRQKGHSGKCCSAGDYRMWNRDESLGGRVSAR